jgi:hypothetical protein
MENHIASYWKNDIFQKRELKPGLRLNVLTLIEGDRGVKPSIEVYQLDESPISRKEMEIRSASGYKLTLLCFFQKEKIIAYGFLGEGTGRMEYTYYENYRGTEISLPRKCQY